MQNRQMAIEFSFENPFPLLAHDAFTLQEAQDHAAEVDRWLGLEIASCEERARGNQAYGMSAPRARENYWLNLPSKTLLTPYLELRRMVEDLHLPAGAALVDLGAGYGRLGFLLGHQYVNLSYIGFEIVAERVAEVQRCAERSGIGSRVQHHFADVSSDDFALPAADAFFIYDFGSREAIAKVLSKLKRLAQTRAIAVVARGGSSRSAIEREHPWLSEIVAPKHFKNYSIYFSHEISALPVNSTTGLNREKA